MEYIRKQVFSLNSCHPFRAWGKNHSAATQRPESSKDQRDHSFFSANEFWEGNTYRFILQGLKSYFINDAACWVCFMTWRLFPVTIPCGAVGLSSSWVPACSLNRPVALGSQFAPVKSFPYLLHAPRMAKVKAGRCGRTHNASRKSLHNCVSPETAVNLITNLSVQHGYSLHQYQTEHNTLWN